MVILECLLLGIRYHDFVKNIRTGETEAMIMANELDLENSLSDARQFIPSSFRFAYKNAPLSLVQEPKIKLSMITKISSDEYLVAFKIKKGLYSESSINPIRRNKPKPQ